MKKVQTDDCMMTWAAMWQYFKSSRCTDDQRKFTMDSLNLYDCLDGAMPEVQFEIMECAPEYLLEIDMIRGLLDTRVIERLERGMQQSKSGTIGEGIDDRKERMRVGMMKAYDEIRARHYSTGDIK